MNRTRRLFVTAVLGIALVVTADRGLGQQPVDLNDPSQRFENFERVIKNSKEYDGLFKLHQKDDHLFAEIQPQQFDKPFLLPIAIARGAGMGGLTLNFDEQWVLLFKRVGDKIHLIRRNVHFTAKAGSPAAKAVETTYNDSVLMALRIVAINPQRQSVLINLNDIFMTDFAGLGLGAFDTNRSVWHKVKAFPRNIEIEVAATYAGGNSRWDDDSVIDSRGKTVIIHYGLCQLPEGGYQPRMADDRVGFFLSVVKDFSTDSSDSTFVRYVNRWRLERAEPVDHKHPDRLSAPKKKIVFWIERSVPDEFRASVREGILEWNKAFEKVGFKDAIEVRQQQDEDFDPEDINYNTFRWITTDGGFAMGPSRANPLTGEILDADIIFDASMVRYWRHEYKLLNRGHEPISLIEAARKGWQLLPPDLYARAADGSLGWNDRAPDPADVDNLRSHLQQVRTGLCQCATHLRYELDLASLAMADREIVKANEKVPDELLQQAVKETVMHEVGHTLGLRHNFKSSTMLKNEQLNDTAITRVKGLSGSVMDYNPINLAPKGVKQGDYFSTTLGPYDYLAIEYAYKPLDGGTEGEREKLHDIAKQLAKPGNDYATDEDMIGSSDPLVNVWDLGSDPMKFGEDRIQLASELLKGMADRVVEKGEGYQRARTAFDMLLGQYANGTYLVSAYIGGVHMNRDHRNDPDGRDPFVPAKSDKQREALKFLQEHVLSDKTFQFSPELLRKLASDRWMHWGNDESMSSTEYPLYQPRAGDPADRAEPLLRPRHAAPGTEQRPANAGHRKAPAGVGNLPQRDGWHLGRPGAAGRRQEGDPVVGDPPQPPARARQEAVRHRPGQAVELLLDPVLPIRRPAHPAGRPQPGAHAPARDRGADRRLAKAQGRRGRRDSRPPGGVPGAHRQGALGVGPGQRLAVADIYLAIVVPAASASRTGGTPAPQSHARHQTVGPSVPPVPQKPRPARPAPSPLPLSAAHHHFTVFTRRLNPTAGPRHLLSSPSEYAYPYTALSRLPTGADRYRGEGG